MKSLFLIAAIPILLPACELFSDSDPASTKTVSPEGVTTITESVEAMKERMFQERCDAVLERKFN